MYWDYLRGKCSAISEYEHVAPICSRLVFVKVHSVSVADRRKMSANKDSAISELEQKLKEARASSYLANKKGSKFLSNMSHELRTPLNAILGFAQMIEEHGATCEQDYIKYILSSGNDLLDKVNSLLEMADINRGKTSLKEVPVNIREIIDEAIELNSHDAFAADINIRVTLENPSMVIMADKNKLIDVLGNLIANSIASSAIGSVINIKCTAIEGHSIVISVRDNGCGISDEKLMNIRRALANRESYFLADIDGIGIGLAMAKEITELHGGNLSIDSEQGIGTVAVINLPPLRIVSLSAKAKLKQKKVGMSA